MTRNIWNISKRACSRLVISIINILKIALHFTAPALLWPGVRVQFVPAFESRLPMLEAQRLHDSRETFDALLVAPVHGHAELVEQLVVRDAILLALHEHRPDLAFPRVLQPPPFLLKF